MSHEDFFSPDFKIISPRSSSPTLTPASPLSRGPLRTFFTGIGSISVKLRSFPFFDLRALEALGHHLGSPPWTPWESLSLQQVWVPSVLLAVDLIFLIPGKTQWKWTLGTSDWRVNTSSSQEVFGMCGLLQGQSRHFLGSSPLPYSTLSSSHCRDHH